MAYPKVTWIDEAGNAQQLAMLLPPTKRPAVWFERVGEDTLSTAGARQSITMRVDEFLELNLEWVEPGDEVAKWIAFHRWALLYTGEFEYFEDADADIHDTYELAYSSFKPEFANRRYKLKLKLRKAVA